MKLEKIEEVLQKRDKALPPQHHLILDLKLQLLARYEKIRHGDLELIGLKEASCRSYSLDLKLARAGRVKPLQTYNVTLDLLVLLGTLSSQDRVSAR